MSIPAFPAAGGRWVVNKSIIQSKPGAPARKINLISMGRRRRIIVYRDENTSRWR